jgi:hypothetical protein
MTVTQAPVADIAANGLDGADTAQKPAQAIFTGLGWDFSGVWKMGTNYPEFK